MLKFINLKKLTAKTLIGILLAGGLVAQAGTKKAVASNGVQGLELRYLDSAFQCGPGQPQANIKVKVYDQDDNLLVKMSKGDTFVTSDVDSMSDLKFKYKIKNTCFNENWRNSEGSQLLGAGDTVPNVGGAFGQASITQMLSGLDSYEELYLVELGTSNTSSSNYDLQDVVLVVDNNPDSLVEAQADNDTEPETVTSPDQITLTGTLRDVRGYRDINGNINPAGHEDFERKHNVDTNPSGQKFKYGLDKGITTDFLGADKKPIYAGGSFSTTTQENFDQWYRDVSGVNQSMTYDIVLNKKAGSDVYSFNNNGEQFFPLDGLLFGNEGRSHNYHFTFEIHTEFTYRGGETFKFSGDDDVWVYINGQKVIDIGGVHGKKDASVNLDSLGLTEGETYDLDFFFAERHVTKSNFKIETTIALEAAANPDDDEDNDGISNLLEGFETEVDSDGDGTPDYLDDDSDNNEIPDSEEVGTVADPSDSDGDGTPNFQDDDDDGNGIPDVDEIGNDPTNPTNTDNTDLPDYQDTDDDNDGIVDIDEIGDNAADPTDTDGDETPDYHDLDSDGDTIPDSDEGSEDFDGDNTPNFQDDDSDGDTIPDSVETGADSDLDDDSDPNFLDLDSDGDGIPDENEEIADADDDGNTDITSGTTNNVDGEDDGDNYLDVDSDNDGLDDDIDPEPYVFTYAD